MKDTKRRSTTKSAAASAVPAGAPKSKAKLRPGLRSAAINGQRVTAAGFQRQVSDVMADPSPVDMARLLERKRSGTNETRRGRPLLSPAMVLSHSLNVRFDEETYALLRQGRATLAASETDDKTGALGPPIMPTTDWGYFRLRRTDYTESDLKAWLETIRKQPWSEAWVFFKHEDEGNAAVLAASLRALV